MEKDATGDRQALQRQLDEAREETLQLHAQLQRIEAERAAALGSMPGVVPGAPSAPAPAVSPERIAQLEKERTALQRKYDESQREVGDLKAQAEALRKQVGAPPQSSPCAIL